MPAAGSQAATCRTRGSRSPGILVPRFSPAVPTQVFDSYWSFATERQAIFFKRFHGAPPPWTSDPVLNEYKFTNAYRASDRVSQYLIRHVIYQGDMSPAEVFFRTLLFKLFNRIDTWELLSERLGPPTFRRYRFDRYDDVLSRALASGKRIYSAAYIMPSGGGRAGTQRKHTMHLRLLERMMSDRLYERIAKSRSMGQAFENLRTYPTIGDFLAYQYVTDLNYGPLTDFTEMEFVVPGPGSLSGVGKCFANLGGLTEGEIIKWVAERQSDEFQARGLPFQTLWGRPLQLIDCQNLFCEVDKYARVVHPTFTAAQGRTRIKQRYRLNTGQIDYWYPPKWGLNDKIRDGEKHVHGVQRKDG